MRFCRTRPEEVGAATGTVWKPEFSRSDALCRRVAGKDNHRGGL